MELPSSPANLPSPPFYNVPGIANLRDIGGYACTPTPPPSHPTSITRHLVYRSADPSKVTTSGIDRLHELGIHTIFDLRSLPEIQRQGQEWSGVEIDKRPFVDVPAPTFTKKRAVRPGLSRKETEQAIEKGELASDEAAQDDGRIQRIWVPVFADEDYGPEQIAQRYKMYASNTRDGFVNAYRDILKSAPTAYRTIFSHLAAASPKPCLVHCTAGKDRTGVIVALLYLLCGVDKETIAKEYALTDQGLANLKPLFKERLLKNPALEGNEKGVDAMVSSRQENMTDTIQMIEGEFGGAEKYMKDSLGMSGNEIEALRTNLVARRQPIL